MPETGKELTKEQVAWLASFEDLASYRPYIEEGETFADVAQRALTNYHDYVRDELLSLEAIIPKDQ